MSFTKRATNVARFFHLRALYLRRAAARLLATKLVSTEVAYVRRVLGASAEVAGFADAPPERGGWGATVVHLADRPGPPLP